MDPLISAGKGLLAWLTGGQEASPLTTAEALPQAEVLAEEPASELLERFKDEGQIGRGGMSSIRRVYDQNLLRRVAMKVLDPTLAKEKLHVQAFIEEAQITAQLDHPNLVPVHELGVDADGTHYFTMRLIRGQTLAEWISGRKEELTAPLHLQQSIGIVIKVCDALAYAHSKGVLHLDLKPANIMVGTYGEVYLMDWGLSRLVDEAVAVEVRRDAEMQRLRTQSRVSGTPAYMSPEQAMGRTDTFDGRTDIYALGAVLYHLVTGRPPFAGETVQAALMHAANNEFDPPQLATPHLLPPELVRILEKALQAEPAARYQGALDLKQDLEKFLRGGLYFPAQTFAAGTKIVVEGQEGDTAYLIISGQCRVMKAFDGGEREVRVMGAGTVFGEMALLSRRPRTATVEALDEVTALVVSRKDLEDTLGPGSWMGAIAVALADRFREVDEGLTRLMEEKARGENWRLVPP
ncbi:MAG: protein kinase [Deltaproteobacteria bacterium]|nr:protein kinase [Deltaproteobacteria bacterium]